MGLPFLAIVDFFASIFGLLRCGLVLQGSLHRFNARIKPLSSPGPRACVIRPSKRFFSPKEGKPVSQKTQPLGRVRRPFDAVVGGEANFHPRVHRIDSGGGEVVLCHTTKPLYLERQRDFSGGLFHPCDTHVIHI